MIAFWTLVIGVIVGFAIGWAMRSASDDLAEIQAAPFPAATARRIRRAQLAARADLRAVLPRDRSVRS